MRWLPRCVVLLRCVELDDLGLEAVVEIELQMALLLELVVAVVTYFRLALVLDTELLLEPELAFVSAFLVARVVTRLLVDQVWFVEEGHLFAGIER